MKKRVSFHGKKSPFFIFKKGLFIQQKGAFFITPIKDKNDSIKRGNIFIKLCKRKVRKECVLRAGRKKAMTE